MTADDDNLADLGAELRQQVEHEFRWEAEETQADAEKLRLRRRTLSDVALEAMERGDTITVVSGSTTVTGTMAYVRGDLAVIQSGHALASIHLGGPTVLRLTSRSLTGGSSSDHGSGSFKARLAEFEQTGEIITLVVQGITENLEGRISIVGTDHIGITGRDGTEWFAPIAHIALALQPITRR